MSMSPEGAHTEEARMQAEEARAKAAELRQELEKLGQVAKDAAYEQVEQLKHRGQDTARQIEERIQEEPLKSLAIAAGIGFLLGVLWSRD